MKKCNPRNLRDQKQFSFDFLKFGNSLLLLFGFHGSSVRVSCREVSKNFTKLHPRNLIEVFHYIVTKVFMYVLCLREMDICTEGGKFSLLSLYPCNCDSVCDFERKCFRTLF